MRFYFVVLVSFLEVGKRFAGTRRISFFLRNRRQGKQILKYSLQRRVGHTRSQR